MKGCERDLESHCDRRWRMLGFVLLMVVVTVGSRELVDSVGRFVMVAVAWAMGSGEVLRRVEEPVEERGRPGEGRGEV